MTTSSSAVSLSTMNSGFAQGEGADNSSFPAGLRVLVVDDDPICLLILDRMLRRCLYKVTTCGRAIEALNILRENKDGFDLVISDVYMPDMDGFKLLELVGLEMDLPVIMMSTNGETSAVMKGIEHGACNYLLKPVRIEELKNIWQHVVRRRRKDPELPSNFEDRQQDNYGELHISASDEPDGASRHKKRKDLKEEEEDTEQDHDEDPSNMKKPRVVWSVELHQQFVNAVNQLGMDKAVPKRILELMDVRGLTRENVASHLQKYRLYLKKISGVAHQAGGLGPMFGGASEATFGGVAGDVRSQLSPQILVSQLQAGLLGQLGSNNSGTAIVNQSLLHMAAITAGNSGELARSSYGQSSIHSSGSLHLSFSSGLDLKNISNRQQQVAPFSLPEKEAAPFFALQQYVNPVSSADVQQFVGLNSHLPIKTSNKPLMLQNLQQRTSSQLEIGTTLDTSTGRQQILSGESGAEILNVDSFNHDLPSGVGSHFKPGGESSLSNIGLTSSNGFGSFRRNVGMDIQNLNLLPAGNANIDLPSSISSSSISCGNDGRTVTNKGCVSDGGDTSPWSGVISNSAVLSGSNPGSGFHMGNNNWQSLGFTQELGKTTNKVLSPLCNQSFSSQVVEPSSFQDGAIVDAGTFRPLVATAQQSEQLARKSELDFQGDSFEMPLDIKVERATMSEPFSSPDDLLNTYFKQQQQEMIGLSEGDFVAEGYGLGNIYVN